MSARVVRVLVENLRRCLPRPKVTSVAEVRPGRGAPERTVNSPKSPSSSDHAPTRRSIALARSARWASTLLVLTLLGCADSRPEVLAKSALSEPVLESTTSLFRSLMGEQEVRAAPRDPNLSRELEQEQLARDANACRERIQLAGLGQTMPGAPRFEEQRDLILARAKAEPVLFLSEPRFTGEVSPGMRAHRKRLERPFLQRDTVMGILRHFEGILPELRQLLLRDGYFYIDDAAAAHELTTRVGVEDLFREPTVLLLRGSHQITLERKGGIYFHVDGPMKGERARLLLLDRLWLPGEDLGAPLHVDVRPLAAQLGFEQMRIDHLGEREIVAELLFEKEWVPALLGVEGTSLRLDCMLVEPKDDSRIGRARDRAFRRAVAVTALRRAIVEQVRMGLPFDEPRHEIGQQDGKLRPRFMDAYLGGRTKYRFNDDDYRVFDDSGRPMTPQVCIDFVTESLERASGMHFQPRGEAPAKVVGSLDFDQLLGDRRRQELAMREFAREHPEMMRLYDYPQKARIPYEKVNRFFAFLRSDKDRLRAGDVIIIRGRAAWDRYEEIHTHTFFIYENDPISGMPVLLAGNSGKPRLVTWDGEMIRAPKRSLHHRIELNSEWLYDNLVSQIPSEAESLAPPLIVAED